MEPHVLIARVPSSAATGLLMLFGHLAVAAGPVQQPAPIQGRLEVSRPEADGHEQRLKEIDQLIHDGRYTDAETGARNALIAIDAAGEGGSYAAALVSDRLVEALLQGGKWTRSETLNHAEMAVRVKRKLLDPEDVEIARSLERLGRVLTKRADFPEAQHALDRSFAMLASSVGPESLEAATVSQSIGSLACAQSQYDSARPWLEQALVIREKTLGPTDPQVASALRAIGGCVPERGSSSLVLPLLRRSQEIYEATLSGRHPDLGLTLAILGSALRRSGDYDGAKRNLERSAAILERSLGADSPLVAIPLVTLGQVLDELGEYQAARVHLERALAIWLHEYGRDDADVAVALNNLATLHFNMGDYPEAARLYGEAEQIWETEYGPWHPNLSTALQNRGIALAEAGRPAEARPLMQRAVDILIRNLGPESNAVINALANLGQLNGVLGDYTQQRQVCQKAFGIVARLHDTNLRIQAGLQQCLADAARGVGDLSEAATFSGLSVTTTEAIFGPLHPLLAGMLQFHARILVEGGRYADGLAAAIRSEAISREHLALTVGTATESEALTYASTRASTIDLLVTMAGLHDRGVQSEALAAWDSVIRVRALVLDEMVARRRAVMENSDPEIARLRDDLTHATEQLAKLIVAGPRGGEAAGFGVNVDTVRQERFNVERALAVRSAEFRTQLALSRAGVSDMIAALPASSAIVAFAEYGHVELTRPAGGKVQEIEDSTPSYAVFVLSPASAVPLVIPLADTATIDAMVTRYREARAREARSAGHASKAGEASYRKAAEDLRRVVWDPVAGHLGTAKQVFIVPDGALNLVTFAALPIGESRYLVEEGLTIHYLSAERDLLTPGRAGAQDGLLALSNPDFDDRRSLETLRPAPTRATALPESESTATFRGLRSTCGSFQSMRFEALPASLLETKEITRIWGNQVKGSTSLRSASGSAESAVSFTGPAANETMFKHTASGHRVLHLATHGFFLGGDCTSPPESLPADSSGSSADAVTRENPLLLSGLVFAGANSRDSAGPEEDDGILTAQEIGTLDLRGTEWAVLSACDTGTGEIRAGEGVFGLRRAFQLAGARTVIMSLWPVEDEATRQWMTALYRHRFVEGKSTMASAHDASLELLQQRRARGESTHPFYWAGFIAAGDWR